MGSILAPVLLFALLPSILTETCYVRTSDHPISSCPGQPCLTLGQYASIYFFTPGTTLLFLPGSHILEGRLRLDFGGLSNITLRGYSSNQNETAIIVCTEVVTIQCAHVRELTIEELTFQLNYYIPDQHHYIGNFRVTDGKAALKLISCENVLIYRTTFKSEVINMSMLNQRALVMHNSVVKISICQFKNNMGGAIASYSSNIVITGSSFYGNRGIGDGGSLTAFSSTVLLDGSVPNLFLHSSDMRGGAICCSSCELDLSGKNSFRKCLGGLKNTYIRLLHGGGAIFAANCSNISISGTANFSENTALEGGALLLDYSTVLLNGTITFYSNQALYTGGAISLVQAFIHTISNDVSFVNNYADQGGAIAVRKVGPQRTTVSAIFTNNAVKNNGGAVYATSAVMEFADTSFVENRHSALSFIESNITFTGTTLLTRNLGGGLQQLNSFVLFQDTAMFTDNSGQEGGGLNCFYGQIIFNGHTVFMQNFAEGDGGAIYAVGTSVEVAGFVNFTYNTAQNGGAMYLDSGASMSLQPSTVLLTSHNLALRYGGAIYHADNPTLSQCNRVNFEPTDSLTMPLCFVRSLYPSPARVHSHNDLALRNGDFLYGGLLDRCRLSNSEDQSMDSYYLLEVYGIFFIESQTNERLGTASEPYDLCICQSNVTTIEACNKFIALWVYRGQEFTLPLTALNQVGVASTEVIAITSSKARLEIHQNAQHLSDYCQDLHYTLFSSMLQEQVILYPDGPCRDSGSASVKVNVTFLPCPEGFSKFREVCICEERLHHYDINCTIAEIPYLTKAENSQFWIGVTYDENTTYQGLILSERCPVDYCKTQAVNITLENTDEQCDLNRSGLLCGACAANFSLMLGSSRCYECSNVYLALLVAFSAAGIALVIFLSVLRLTIATGTLNSMILYANIVQVNRKLFILKETTNILTVFIAWLNLDLGFQTCFYNGLDAYIQTWLQFAFPFYVWIIIISIILISRYSITVSKLIGHNPIAVLATLLLMSYTKILKIIIEVYSSTEVEYPNETTRVWLKDANIPYLQSRHLVLTVVTSLVLVFFFIPYTFLLLTGFKLYRFSGRKGWRWLNRLKPLLDSYYGPYQTRTRYWTGFLLLVRCVLYVIFLLDSLDAKKSLISISITFTAIGFLMGIVYSGRIYRKLRTNVIDLSVYFNLIVLATSTLAALNSTVLVYLFVSHIFVTIIFICAMQFHDVYLVKTSMWLQLRLYLSRFKQQPKDNSSDTAHVINTSHDVHKIVSQTTVDLRESLLDSYM